MEEVMFLEETNRVRDEATEGVGDGATGGVGDRENPLSPIAQPSAADTLPAEMAQLRAELAEVRARGLEAHRRALLAENAGRVVPELVAGSTAEELEASVDVARRAFDAARAAALAEVVATSIPAGNPVRQGPSVEGMSPLEKIAYGLRR
jgi:hypothetical protein